VINFDYFFIKIKKKRNCRIQLLAVVIFHKLKKNERVQRADCVLTKHSSYFTANITFSTSSFITKKQSNINRKPAIITNTLLPKSGLPIEIEMYLIVSK